VSNISVRNAIVDFAAFLANDLDNSGSVNNTGLETPSCDIIRISFNNMVGVSDPL